MAFKRQRGYWALGVGCVIICLTTYVILQINMLRLSYDIRQKEVASGELEDALRNAQGHLAWLKSPQYLETQLERFRLNLTYPDPSQIVAVAVSAPTTLPVLHKTTPLWQPFLDFLLGTVQAGQDTAPQ